MSIYSDLISDIDLLTEKEKRIKDIVVDNELSLEPGDTMTSISDSFKDVDKLTIDSEVESKGSYYPTNSKYITADGKRCYGVGTAYYPGYAKLATDTSLAVNYNKKFKTTNICKGHTLIGGIGTLSYISDDITIDVSSNLPSYAKGKQIYVYPCDVYYVIAFATTGNYCMVWYSADMQTWNRVLTYGATEEFITSRLSNIFYIDKYGRMFHGANDYIAMDQISSGDSVTIYIPEYSQLVANGIIDKHSSGFNFEESDNCVYINLLDYPDIVLQIGDENSYSSGTDIVEISQTVRGTVRINSEITVIDNLGFIPEKCILTFRGDGLSNVAMGQMIISSTNDIVSSDTGTNCYATSTVVPFNVDTNGDLSGYTNSITIRTTDASTVTNNGFISGNSVTIVMDTTYLSAYCDYIIFGRKLSCSEFVDRYNYKPTFIVNPEDITTDNGNTVTLNSNALYADNYQWYKEDYVYSTNDLYHDDLEGYEPQTNFVYNSNVTSDKIGATGSVYLTDVIYANGNYIAAGHTISSGKYYPILMLTDGEPSGTWQYAMIPVSTGGNTYLRSITYGNGYYVAVGYNDNGPFMLYSANGNTWSQNEYINNDKLGLDNNGLLRSIIYANGYYIAVGYDSLAVGFIIYAKGDPTNAWTCTKVGIGEIYLNDITYANGYYIAVGYDNAVSLDNQNPLILYTTDPTGEWTYNSNVTNDKYGFNSDNLEDGGVSTLSSNLYLYSISYGNGYYVAVGYGILNGVDSVDTPSDPIILYTKDPTGEWAYNSNVTREKYGLSESADLISVTYANGYFIAVNNNSVDGVRNPFVLYTKDPTGEWVYDTNTTNDKYGFANNAWLMSIIYANNYYISVGYNILTADSTTRNPLILTKEYVAPDAYITQAEYEYNSNVTNEIYGFNNVTNLRSIIYANGYYIAVGNTNDEDFIDNPRILYTKDPTGEWSYNSNVTNDKYGFSAPTVLYSITYANGYYIAVGNSYLTGTISNPLILYTKDPTGEWTYNSNVTNTKLGLKSSGTTILESITYANGYYIAVGNNRSAASSISNPLILYTKDPTGEWAYNSNVTNSKYDFTYDSYLSSITYANGYYIAVGVVDIYNKSSRASEPSTAVSTISNPLILYTKDPTGEWTYNTNVTNSKYGFSNNTYLNSITYANGYYIAVGNSYLSGTTSNPLILYTKNPTGEWTYNSNVTNDKYGFSKDTVLYSITYANGYYIAVGYSYLSSSISNPLILYTKDPTGEWTYNSNVTNSKYGFTYDSYLYSITHTNGYYIAVGYSYLTGTIYNPLILTSPFPEKESYYLPPVKVPGATSANLTLNNVDYATDTGDRYYAVARNSLGYAVSNKATVIINSPLPVIITPPVMPSNIEHGTDVSLSVTAKYATTYEWYVSNDSSSDGSSLNNTETTLLISNVNYDTDNGKNYFCKITNKNGSINTNRVVLNIESPYVVFTTDLPDEYTGTVNTRTVLSVETTGNVLSYQWYTIKTDYDKIENIYLNDIDISTQLSSAYNGETTSIIYVNGYYIAAINSSTPHIAKIVYTTELSSGKWNVAYLSAPGKHEVKCIIYANGYYVAVGLGIDAGTGCEIGLVWYSKQLESSWQVTVVAGVDNEIIDEGYHLYSVAYGNGYYVAVGSEIVGTSNRYVIYYTQDLESNNWTQSTDIDDKCNVTTMSSCLNSITYAKSKFVTVGYSSNDGITYGLIGYNTGYPGETWYFDPIEPLATLSDVIYYTPEDYFVTVGHITNSDAVSPLMMCATPFNIFNASWKKNADIESGLLNDIGNDKNANFKLTSIAQFGDYYVITAVDVSDIHKSVLFYGNDGPKGTLFAIGNIYDLLSLELTNYTIPLVASCIANANGYCLIGGYYTRTDTDTYPMLLNSEAIIESAPIPNQVSNELVFPSLDYSDAGQYYVTATNKWETKTSNILTLYVDILRVTFTKDLPSTTNGVVTNSVTLSVEANNADTYKWYKYVDGTNDTLISGTTNSPSYTLNGLVTSQSGEKYYCTAMNSTENISANSTITELYVDIIHVIITQDLQSVYASTANETVSFTVITENATAYEWHKQGIELSTAGDEWTYNSNVTNAKYNFTGNTIIYSVTASNGYYIAVGCHYLSGSSIYNPLILYSKILEDEWTYNTNVTNDKYEFSNHAFLFDVIKSGNYFVAVGYRYTSSGYEPLILYTTDPTGEWTYNSNVTNTKLGLKSSGTTILESITYANGYYIAVGACYAGNSSIYNPLILYTTDPTGEWTYNSNVSNSKYGFISAARLHSVIYESTNKYYIAVGEVYVITSDSTTQNSPLILYTKDPTGEWTYNSNVTIDKLGFSMHTVLRSIIYYNSYYIAVGYSQLSGSINNPLILYTTDPTGEWTYNSNVTNDKLGISTPTLLYFNTFCGGHYLAAGYTTNNPIILTRYVTIDKVLPPSSYSIVSENNTSTLSYTVAMTDYDSEIYVAAANNWESVESTHCRLLIPAAPATPTTPGTPTTPTTPTPVSDEE